MNYILLKRLPVVCLFIFIFLWSADATAQGASGLHNPLFGAAALAQGNAFVARADAASAIQFNPAGLTQLLDPEGSLGAAFMFPSAEYHGPGGNQDMDTKVNIQPNIYFAGPILENKLAAGIGLTAPYGLNGKWRNNGFSRFVVADFDLRVIDINPSIAFKPFSFASIGAGLDYYLVDTDVDGRVNTAPSPEGFRDLETDGDALGYNIGLLFNLTPQHSVGISFRSKADVHLEGRLKIFNLPAGVFGTTSLASRARARATIPEMLSFGYAYRHGNLWSIEADAQWTNWSRFDVINYSFSPTNPLLEAGKRDIRNWRNTLSFGVGGEYKLNEALRLRAGYTFHETPVPSTTFEPSVPQSSRHAVFVGFGYEWGKKSLDGGEKPLERRKKWIDFAYGAVFYEDRDINNNVGEVLGAPILPPPLMGPPIDGDYDLFTHIIAVNFNYRF